MKTLKNLSVIILFVGFIFLTIYITKSYYVFNDLQYQVAKVGKSYNHALRTLDSKLEEFGIPPEDTGFQPLQTTQTSTLPAGLVTGKK